METAELMDALVKTGPTGIVLLLIITGQLITKRHLEDMTKEKDAWKTVAEREQERGNALEKATDSSMEQGNIALAIFRELRNSSQKETQ